MRDLEALRRAAVLRLDKIIMAFVRAAIRMEKVGFESQEVADEYNETEINLLECSYLIKKWKCISPLFVKAYNYAVVLRKNMNTVMLVDDRPPEHVVMTAYDDFMETGRRHYNTEEWFKRVTRVRERKANEQATTDSVRPNQVSGMGGLGEDAYIPLVRHKCRAK